MFSFLKCFIVIAWSHHAVACSYKFSRAPSHVEAKVSYVANEYCGQTHIDLGLIPVLKQDSRQFPPKQYCGSFSNAWSAVNTTIVMAPIGERFSWVILSARVMRDCNLLPNSIMGPNKNPLVNRVATTVYDSDGMAQNISPMSSAEIQRWKNLWNLCWQSCSYRSGGSFITNEPPATFEFMYAPFNGPISTAEMMSSKVAASGYAEFAPSFMLLTAVNFATVELVMDSDVGNADWILVFARNTFMMVAFLEYDQRFLNRFLFPEVPTSDHTDFWGELGGCLGDSYVGSSQCPRLACGDFEVQLFNVMNDYTVKGLISGSLDGNEIEGGCANPFIPGYTKGLNTTESGEEILGSAVSLQLLDPVMNTLYNRPPVVGPFEDLVTCVCPHAWFTHGSHDGGPDGWAEMLSLMSYDDENWESKVGELDDWNHITFADRCKSDSFDVFSNRILLPTTSAFHYGLGVMYMPSEMEVYLLKQYETIHTAFIGGRRRQLSHPGTTTPYGAFGVGDEAKAASLMRIKLRYRGHEAEHHAVEDINKFNSRVLSAEECGGDLSETSFNIAQGESNYPADQQEPCVYMNYLLMITAACAEASGTSKDKKMCQEAVEAVLKMLREVCDASCSADIMSGYFCTSVTTLTGARCGNADVLFYYMDAASTVCDAWMLEFTPEYCYSQGGSAYGGVESLTDGLGGWTDSAKASGSYDCRRLASEDGRQLSHCGRRLFSDNGPGLSHDIANGRSLSHDISAMSSFNDMNALDNMIPVTDWIASTQSDGLQSFMKFPDTFSSAVSFTQNEFKEHASTLLTYTKGWLVDESLKPSIKHAGRISLISTGIIDALTEDIDGEHTYAQLRDFFGEFLFRTAQVWESLDASGNDEDDLLPVFATCDAEFEESLVRDDISLDLTASAESLGVEAGEQGSCKWPPAQLSSSMIQSMMDGRYARSQARYFWN